MADSSLDMVIKETAQGGLEIRLTDSDMPYGRPREKTAFESGGDTEVAEGGIYLPGNTRQVVQIMKVKQRPFVINGAFRDHLFKNGTPGHARSMRNSFEEMRYRAAPVSITWADDTRTGVLIGAKFAEEGKGDIGYELSFLIIESPSARSKEAPPAQQRPGSPDDIAADMRARAAAISAAQLALVITASTEAALSNAWTSVLSAMDDVTTYSIAFAASSAFSPQSILSASRRVQAACQAAQNNIATLRATLDSTRADAAMVYADASSAVSWWGSLYDSDVVLDQILDAMRSIRETVLAQVRQATTLYRVQPGDTLESIALAKLGGRARALDLGIRQDDLVVGAWVRVPEAN